MHRTPPSRLARPAFYLVTALLLLATLPAFAAPGRKVTAEPGLIDGMAGVTLLHQYGSFSLYRVADGVLESLPPSLRARLYVREDHDRLTFDAYPFDTQREAIHLPPELTAGENFGPGLHLVQFVGPIKDEWLTNLRDLGIEPVHYVANHGYLVWTDAAGRQALATMAQAANIIQWDAPLHPYFKLGPTLRNRLEAKVPDAAAAIPVVIQMYRHTGRQETEDLIARKALAQLTPWQPILAYQNVDVTLRVGDLAEIAARPDVNWIGERMKRERLDEVQGQIIGGNFDGSQTGPSGPGYLAFLTGLGFSTTQSQYPIVDVTDDGIGNGTTSSGDPTLHELGSTSNPTRLAYVANCTTAADGGGPDGHGHINTSIAGGYDTRSGFPYRDPDGFQRGMGINPWGRFAGTRVFGPSFNLSACGGTDTGLIKSEQDRGAKISSNSWGCSGCASTYDDSSQAFDVGVRDADLTEAGNQELTFIFAAGNSGSGAGTVGTPGNGKNMITVGASENDRQSDEGGSWTDGCGIGASGVISS